MITRWLPLAVLAVAFAHCLSFGGPNVNASYSLTMQKHVTCANRECIRVCVEISNVVEMDGYVVGLRYNPDKLRFSKASIYASDEKAHSFVESFGGKTAMTTVRNSTPGIVELITGLIGNNPEKAAKGSGTIMYAWFETGDKNYDDAMSIGEIQLIDTEYEIDCLTGCNGGIDR